MVSKTSRFRSALRSQVSARAIIFGVAASVAVGPVAYAQSLPNTSANSSINLDLGSVLATGAATSDGDPNIPGTAANEAPSRASLKETQPTSVISGKFVQNTMVPTVNYSDIMNISPSASSTDQSGPGLDESKHVEMRGFQDGFYNVTFDGVPYGDSNDFTHHTTTFFMANDVGETIVDRGPGTASTSGNATFGGTVAIVSKDPLPNRTLTAYGTYGSYATYIGGAEADTGSLMGGTTGFVDGEYAGSDTYNTNAKIDRSNVFAKLVKPLGSNFVLTTVAMYNSTYQQYAEGGTQAQIAEYGPQFGLSDNPLSQNYKDYQTDHYKTDFEYIDLRGTFGDGWTIDSKLYTYAYYHHSLNGLDPLDCGDGETACVTLNGNDISGKTSQLSGQTNTAPSPLIVPGQFKFNTYRSFGTISRVQKDFAVFNLDGDVKFGAWYDHQTNTRALIDENLVTGIALLPGPPPSTEPIERLMHDTLDTFQPYAQLDLKPVTGLTITPGVKWDYFKRGINAPVNQKTTLPLGYEKDYTKIAPSVEANYAVTAETSVYAQYAVGFLAPNLNVLYTTEPGESNLQPETTNNYQAGVVYQSANFAGDADAYYIPFVNFISSKKINGVTIFSNGGGAIFEGIEGEGTYVLGGGWNIYANGSVNSAKYNNYKGKNWVAETPQATAALGLIYDDGHWNGSVTDKWTGGKFGVDSNKTAPYNSFWYDPYNIVNASVGVDINRAPGIPAMKVSLDLENITGQTQAYDYSETTPNYTPKTVYNTLVSYTLPGRSVFLTLRVPIAF